MTGPVVLVGAPGAGKSTVGALLARALRTTFTDTDDLVEEATGKSVAEIFVDDGEPAFRALERAAVGRGLAGPAGVLALGGGAVLDPATRAALASHTVVHLEVGLAGAAQRVGLNRDRPLLLGNPRSQLKRLMDERRPLYAEVAVLTVDTDGRSAAQVAEAVVAALAERS